MISKREIYSLFFVSFERSVLVMKGIFNHENNNFIWYHSTLRGLASKILKEGLVINSIPTFQESPEPRIYVSTHPFTSDKDFITFQVDLSNFDEQYAKWPFNEINKPINHRWQLCIYKNIPAKLLSPFS